MRDYGQLLEGDVKYDRWDGLDENSDGPSWCSRRIRYRGPTGVIPNQQKSRSSSTNPIDRWSCRDIKDAGPGAQELISMMVGEYARLKARVLSLLGLALGQSRDRNSGVRGKRCRGLRSKFARGWAGIG